MKAQRFVSRLSSLARAAHLFIAEQLADPLFKYGYRAGFIHCDDDPLTPKFVKDQMDKAAEKVREWGEKAVDEAKKGGLTPETKTRIDEMLADYGTTVAMVKDVAQKMAKQEDDLKNRGTGEQKSLGALVTENDAFKDWQKTGDVRQGFKHSIERSVYEKAITSSLASAGDAVAPDFRPGILPLAMRRFTIRDLMLPGSTNGNAVTYVKQTGWTNNAAPVSETVKKPESTLVLDAVTQSVITIAHYLKASKQILDDVPQLQSFINGQLAYGLKFVEEVQLLKGSGVGQNLNGIYTQATPYVQPSGVVVDTETIIDRIRLAMLQVMLTDFPASGIVLNPIDWASIELTKDANHNYIVGKPTESLGARLWNLPVVDTQAMTVNTGLVGAFVPFSQIFDRETMNVIIATMNEDDFVKNMITVRCEERLASAVYRPEAFVKIADLTP